MSGGSGALYSCTPLTYFLSFPLTEIHVNTSNNAYIDLNEAKGLGERLERGKGNRNFLEANGNIYGTHNIIGRRNTGMGCQHSSRFFSALPLINLSLLTILSSLTCIHLPCTKQDFFPNV